MPRRAIAGLVVVGLGVGIWLLWPTGGQAGSTTTIPNAGPSTTASPTITTSTVMPTTTTTADVTATHVVETVEEAEAILRELWFGWFEGIYNEDVERIREVVATEEQVEAAVAQFGKMEFLAEPTADDLDFSETEILRTDERCLAIWSVIDARSIIGASNDGVHVFRSSGSNWLFVSQWADRRDLWQDDCDAHL